MTTDASSTRNKLQFGVGGISPVLVLDQLSLAFVNVGGERTGWHWEFLRGKMLKAGLSPDSFSIISLPEFLSGKFSGRPVIGLGEETLTKITDKRSVDKWHLSPLKTKDGSLFISSFDLSRIHKQYECGLYLELAFHRLAELAHSTLTKPVERFLLNPPIEETIEVLKFLKGKDEISADVETGYGQINTVGFAWSPEDAIAINALPDRCSDVAYHELWLRIDDVLKSESLKIFQNFIYDTSYFSHYGAHVGSKIFCTMHAMKVLWPELDSNLGNVGRIYTKRVYWKDDGRSDDGQGKKWGDVRDWVRHYTYNCRDTTGTFAASIEQRKDLSDRGLTEFYSYIQGLMSAAREMVSVGVPVDFEERDRLSKKILEDIEKEIFLFQKEAKLQISPRSPKQILSYLESKKIKVPKKLDKETGVYKRSVDASSIRKIRLSRPDMKELQHIQSVAALSKTLSTYVNFEEREDGRLSYGLNITGNEFLGVNNGKDHRGYGFNVQAISRENEKASIKSMLCAPDGYSFCEIRLREPESRLVAYDAADKALISLLEGGGDLYADIGSSLLKQLGIDRDSISEEVFLSKWRSAAEVVSIDLNYGAKLSSVVEDIFNETDHVPSRSEAEKITAFYYSKFPGIPAWHKWIRDELYSKKKIKTPTGWERYFYGRPGDDMLRDALMFRPKHTTSFITGKLMLYLCDLRDQGKLKFLLSYRTDDSIMMICPDVGLGDLANVGLDLRAGHPTIDLHGGRCFIPRKVMVGKRMSELEEWGA